MVQSSEKATFVRGNGKLEINIKIRTLLNLALECSSKDLIT